MDVASPLRRKSNPSHWTERDLEEKLLSERYQELFAVEMASGHGEKPSIVQFTSPIVPNGKIYKLTLYIGPTFTIIPLRLFLARNKL